MSPSVGRQVVLVALLVLSAAGADEALNWLRPSRRVSAG